MYDKSFIIWAGSHFFGIGEIADVILLIVGWVAVGGVAAEAGKKLYDFEIKTHSARMEVKSWRDIEVGLNDYLSEMSKDEAYT